MVNRSKVNDPRFQKRWKDSGALGGMPDAIRVQALNHYKEMLRHTGNLSDDEIHHLTHPRKTQTIASQVQNLFLRLKADKPGEDQRKLAQRMLNETQPILAKGINSEEDICNLVRTLYKYWSGFMIYHEGHRYSISENRIEIDGKPLI